MNKIRIHYGYMTKEWITDFNRCISKASGMVMNLSARGKQKTFTQRGGQMY